MNEIESIVIDGRNVDEIVINGKTWVASTPVTINGNPIVAVNVARSDVTEWVIYGKSWQDGTPTLDNPVEIQSVDNPTITVGTESNTALKSVLLPYMLRGIDDIRDCIRVRSDGTGELVRRCVVAEVTQARFHKSGNNYIIYSGYTGYSFPIRPDSDVWREKCLCNVSGEAWLVLANGYFRVPTSVAESVDRINQIADLIYFVAPLDTDKITPLTAEQVQEILAALALYKPTTVIGNNKNADMSLTYRVRLSQAVQALNTEYQSALEELK